MYARQRGSRASSEPRKRHSGSRKRKQSTASTTLKTKATTTSRLKSSLASRCFPSPIFLATRPLPPLPNIMPRREMRKIMGMVMLMADRPSVFTHRATKMPSTVE